MEPTFINLPEMKTVGLGTNFISIRSPDKNNMNKIPALWHAFVNRMAEIPNKTGDASYGLVEALPKGTQSHKDEMFYIACTEVTAFSTLPAGMLQRTLPAGRYARFTHVGKLDRLEQTMNFIYGTWVPTAGVPLRPAPHIELYDQRFMMDSDQSEFDILLPVV